MRILAKITSLFLLILAGVPGDSPDLSSSARNALYAAQYDKAAVLYGELIRANPANAHAYYGRVLALLEAHHAADAWAVADLALQKTPNTAPAEAAAGLADFRRGDLTGAEKHFVSALRLDPKSTEALTGLARIYSTVSLFRRASDFRLRAYRLTPDDPALALFHANTLKGAEHIAGTREAS